MNKANGLQLQLLINPSSVLDMNEEGKQGKQKNEKQRCWSAVFISNQSFAVVLCSTRIEREVVMRSDVYEGGS